MRLIDALNIIEYASTVEPKPKKGKWLEHSLGFKEWSVCSACGLGVRTSEDNGYEIIEYNYKFCPYCGADMKE